MYSVYALIMSQCIMAMITLFKSVAYVSRASRAPVYVYLEHLLLVIASL